LEGQQFIEDSYRRPKIYLGESYVDFVNLNGSKKYELKAVTQNERKSYQDSAKDILKNSRNQAEKMKVGETLPDYQNLRYKYKIAYLSHS
jgi:hypothetical protein